MRNKNILIIIFILSALSCKNSSVKNVDVSGIKMETLHINRFEKDLFAIRTNDLLKQIPVLRKKYHPFFELFCNNIVRIPAPNDSLLSINLKEFVKDVQIREVEQDCISQYASLSALEDELTAAFQHYKYYFPNKPIPRILSFISGFNYAIISAESTLAIGLDMYLGEQYKMYASIGFPKYKIRKMRKEYLATDCMKGWLESEYELNPSKKDFLSQIIYNGKILYSLDALLPDAQDSLKIGYTAEQLQFCKNNETNLWAFFIEKNLLFSTKQSEYWKYISEGPSTNGLPKETPAMIGNWVGWQIVRKYMSENASVTLKQLMEENDAQKILAKSKYKPQK